MFHLLEYIFAPFLSDVLQPLSKHKHVFKSVTHPSGHYLARDWRYLSLCDSFLLRG